MDYYVLEARMSEALELFRRTCEVRRDIQDQLRETSELLGKLLSTMTREEFKQAQEIFYDR